MLAETARFLVINKLRLALRRSEHPLSATAKRSSVGGRDGDGPRVAFTERSQSGSKRTRYRMSNIVV